jgi:hypothetical protein
VGIRAEGEILNGILSLAKFAYIRRRVELRHIVTAVGIIEQA